MAPTSSSAAQPLKVWQEQLMVVLQILQVLVSFTEEKLRNLLVDHFPVIFVHLAISSDNQRALSRCLDFVKQHTVVDLAAMIKANRQRL